VITVILVAVSSFLMNSASKIGRTKRSEVRQCCITIIIMTDVYKIEKIGNYDGK
jgi:hypothetical protein